MITIRTDVLITELVLQFLDSMGIEQRFQVVGLLKDI
mgnify:CR=1 FL=1